MKNCKKQYNRFIFENLGIVILSKARNTVSKDVLNQDILLRLSHPLWHIFLLQIVFGSLKQELDLSFKQRE